MPSDHTLKEQLREHADQSHALSRWTFFKPNSASGKINGDFHTETDFITNVYLIGEKNVGVLFSRGKISSPRGIIVTFPRPKFQIRHFSPTNSQFSHFHPTLLSKWIGFLH